jgi:hypothetical protein
LVICFISGIILTWRFKWTLSPVKLLPWFVLLTFVSEMTALQWAIKYHTNHCVYNVYQVFQFIFYSLALFQMIKNGRIRKLLLFISIGFSIIAITNLCFIQGVHQFNTINFYSGAIILSFFSGYSLNELFRKTAIDSPFKTPDFWIAGSILVLNSCLIPLELPIALSLPFTPREVEIVIGLIMVVNFIAYTMFIISFWRQYKNRVAAVL